MKSSPESMPGFPRYPASQFTWPFRSRASLQLEATATIDRTLPEAAPGRERAGRLGLKAYVGDHLLDFVLSAESDKSVQVLAWTHLSEADNWASRILAGGPGPEFASGSTYRFKIRFERRDDGTVELRARTWLQGRTEPDGWPLRAELPDFPSMHSIGFDTMHCAATFQDFRAWLIE
jgi:hypothetical protein